MIQDSPTITLQVPEVLFRRLQRVAKRTYRTVEDVLVTSVNVALPTEVNLPEDIMDELAAMNLFKDTELWAATESSLSAAQQRRLRQLTNAADDRDLTPAESAELQELLGLYDLAVLRRAHALTVLAHRGYKLPNRTDLEVYGTQDL